MAKMMAAMTPAHPRWPEFYDKLSGPEGCDFRGTTLDDFKWTCGGGTDKSKAWAILLDMGFDPGAAQASMDYFEEHGGYCDCEILFNVDPSS